MALLWAQSRHFDKSPWGEERLSGVGWEKFPLSERQDPGKVLPGTSQGRGETPGRACLPKQPVPAPASTAEGVEEHLNFSRWEKWWQAPRQDTGGFILSTITSKGCFSSPFPFSSFWDWRCWGTILFMAVCAGWRAEWCYPFIYVPSRCSLWAHSPAHNLALN